MICRKCGVKNRESSIRCFNCGASLTKKTIIPEIIPEDKNNIDEIIAPTVEEDTITEEYEILESVADIEEDVNLVEPVSEEINEGISEENLYTDENVEDIKEATAPETQDVLYTGDEEYNNVDEEICISEEKDVLYTGEENDADEEDIIITDETADVLYVNEENDLTEENEASDSEEVLYTNVENNSDEENNNNEENGEIQSIEVSAPDEDVEFTKKPNKKKLLWLLAIIPLLLIFIIGYIIFDYLNPVANVPETDTLSILKINGPDIIKKTDENGTEYINAIFYGKSGDVLKLKCNDTSYNFTSDKIEINLYLTDLFTSDYIFNSSSVIIDLKAYYIRDKEYLCETPSIELAIPNIETDLTEDSVNLHVSEKYDLSFWVEKDVKVTLNNEELTQNHLGIIAKEIVPAEETLSFELKIEKPYHKTIIKTIAFEKEENPLNLTLSSNVEKIHSGASLTLTYITDKNASVYSNLPVIALSPSLATPDALDVTLDLSSCPYGVVEASITAKVGEKSVKKSIKINYWPNEDELLATAQSFDATLLTTPTYDKNYIFDSVIFTETNGMYRIKGKVGDVEVIFDINDYIGQINFDTAYNVVAKMINENDTPIFKLWYASVPEAPMPEGDETIQPNT